MPDTRAKLPPFNADKAIIAYRRAFKAWERTGAAQIGLKLMRKTWKDWQGEDSLHATAFKDSE